MVGLYRIFTFLAHDVMQAPGDNVSWCVDYSLKKMNNEDLLALRNSALLFTMRIEKELNERP